MKLKRLVIIFFVAICLMGCKANVPVQAVGEQSKSSMFVVIEQSFDYGWAIVYHKDTKVMYAVSRGSYNIGNFTVLVNPDGTPMLYED